MSRTGSLGRLFGHVPEPGVELHPHDLARLRVADGDLVHLASRRGALVLPARSSTQVAPTHAFVAMHWGEEFVGGRPADGPAAAGVNALTSSAHCPQSHQPELKHAAVRITPATLPWRMVGMAWLPDDEVLGAREALRERLADFAYASCVPFGRERTGLLWRAAAEQPVDARMLDAIEARLGLVGAPVLRYADARRGQRRAVRLAPAGDARRVDAFVLAGDTRAEPWLAALLRDGLPWQAEARLLLAPGAAPPSPVAPRSPQVCACFDVDERAIVTRLRTCDGDPHARLRQLRDALRCGTHCGSCVPELQRLVRAHGAAHTRENA